MTDRQSLAISGVQSSLHKQRKHSTQQTGHYSHAAYDYLRQLAKLNNCWYYN